MRRFLILLTAGWLLYPITNYGAETAQARLYCMSLRFQQGHGSPYGGTSDMSSIAGTSYNGELYPTFGSDAYGNPWASGLVLVWSGMGDSGSISMNLPLGVDANGNGYDDFFEVSQGVTNKVSSGTYSTSTYFSGTVTATWNRAAGSASGTCALYLYDYNWDALGTFTCPFTLLQYAGPLTYTPGSNTVSAAISLAQLGSPNMLQGPINFVKSSTDRFNTLTNQPGVWTNASSQTLSFTGEIFSRHIPTWPTNYAGYVFFADGDPSTASPDYPLWVLSINDTNDANTNGIPDFSDNPAGVTPPRAPQLSLARGSTNLLLTVSGSVGHTNQILGISSLTSTNWQMAQSFLQTNDPQVVSLPLPSGTPKFWRVVAW
jgi:hypothetical protein